MNERIDFAFRQHLLDGLVIADLLQLETFGLGEFDGFIKLREPFD